MISAFLQTPSRRLAWQAPLRRAFAASAGDTTTTGAWPGEDESAPGAAARAAFDVAHPRTDSHPHFRVLLGHGALEAALAPRLKDMLAAHAPAGGSSIVVVSGVSERAQRRAAYVLHLLRRAGLSAVSFGCPAPTASNVQAGLESAKRLGAAAVVSVGGGGTIDAGKAIAALLTNGGKATDFAVWGAADDDDDAAAAADAAAAPDAGWAPEAGAAEMRVLLAPSAPHIAIPTLLGSGAETNPSAVLVDDSDASLAPFVLTPQRDSAALALLDFYADADAADAGGGKGKGQGGGAALGLGGTGEPLRCPLPGARPMAVGLGATNPAALLCCLGRAVDELLLLAGQGGGDEGKGGETAAAAGGGGGGTAAAAAAAAAGGEQDLVQLRRRLALAAVLSLARRLAPALGGAQGGMAAAAAGTAGEKHVGKRADAGLWAADADAALASAYVGLLTSVSGFSTAQALALSTAAGGGDGNYGAAGAALLPAALSAGMEALAEGELGRRDGGAGGGGGGGAGSAAAAAIAREYEAGAAEERATAMLRRAAGALGLPGAADAEVPDEALAEALGELLEELGVPEFGDGVGSDGAGLSSAAAQQLVSEAVGSFGGAATRAMGHGLLLKPGSMLSVVEDS